MSYKTDEYRTVEATVERYARLGKLLEDFRTIRSMHFEQTRKTTLSITVDIVSPNNPFDRGFNDSYELNSLMKLPTAWRTKMWEFIIASYTTDIKDLSALLGLNWDEDFILNKLTKT